MNEDDSQKLRLLRDALLEIERIVSRHEQWAQPAGTQPTDMSKIGELARRALQASEQDAAGGRGD